MRLREQPIRGSDKIRCYQIDLIKCEIAIFGSLPSVPRTGSYSHGDFGDSPRGELLSQAPLMGSSTVVIVPEYDEDTRTNAHRSLVAWGSPGERPISFSLARISSARPSNQQPLTPWTVIG